MGWILGLPNACALAMVVNDMHVKNGLLLAFCVVNTRSNQNQLTELVGKYSIFSKWHFGFVIAGWISLISIVYWIYYRAQGWSI